MMKVSAKQNIFPGVRLAAGMLLLVLLCSACGPPGGPPEEIEAQVEQLATQTQVARTTTTAQASERQPTITPPGASPTPEPVASSDPTGSSMLERTGPFRQVSASEALIAGRVQELVVEGDEIWLLSEHGFSRYQNGDWEGYLTDFMGRVIGQDRRGWFWVAAEDGSQIAAWDWNTWQVFTSTLGWTPVGELFGATVKPPLVEDANGMLWVTTAQDVRRFDGSRWEVYTHIDLQMPAPQEPDFNLEYILLADPAGNGIYAGRCDWGGPGPFGGGGVSRFRDERWERITPQLNTGCISVLEVGPDGSLWVGQEQTLQRLPANATSWETLPPPQPPQAETRLGFFISLTFDPQGDPWPAWTLCGGASCFGGDVLYTWEQSAWQQVGDIGEGVPRRPLFSGDGSAWLLHGFGIDKIEFQAGGVSLTPVAGLNVLAATMDANGRIWLLAQGSGAPTLWTLGEQP